MRRLLIPLTAALAMYADPVVALFDSVLLPDSYSAGPTWGVVADSDTKQPIGGVLVIAMWNLGETNHPLQAMESVTNAKGEFRMLAWGPIARRSGTAIGDSDPILIFYKPGYAKLGRESNYWSAPGENPRLRLPDRTFAYNGETTFLKKYNGSLEGYIGYLFALETQLSYVLEGQDRCRWKEVPRTIRMLEDETNRLLASKPNRGAYFSARRLMQRPECAPVVDFLRKYEEPY